MKTLQPGTKVLIEATVEATKDNDVMAVTKSAYLIRVDKSDLTVCETAKVDTPATQQIEVGDVIIITETDWVDITTGKEYPIIKLHGSEFVIVKGDSGADKHIYIGTFGHFEIKKKPVPTPSFKAGQEGWKPEDSCEWDMPQPNKNNIIKGNGIIQAICGGMAWVNDQEGDFHTIPLEELRRPIHAQPTVESELMSIINDRLVNSNCDESGYGGKRHYSLKDSKIDIYNAILAWHQKHSGRGKVSVPSDEEIDNAIDQYGFQIPYDGSNKFYNDDKIKHFKAGVDWFRHFMARKEANQ